MKKNSNKFSKFYTFSKFLGIAFIATTMLSACSGSSSNPTPNPTVNTDPTCAKPTLDAKLARTQVLGTWKWIQTETTGRAGTTIETPASTGKTQSITFKEDGTVEYAENGKVFATYTYEVAIIAKDMVLSNFDKGTLTSSYTVASCSMSLKLTDIGTSLNSVTLYNK